MDLTGCWLGSVGRRRMKLQSWCLDTIGNYEVDIFDLIFRTGLMGLYT